MIVKPTEYFFILQKPLFLFHFVFFYHLHPFPLISDVMKKQYKVKFGLFLNSCTFKARLMDKHCLVFCFKDLTVTLNCSGSPSPTNTTTTLYLPRLLTFTASCKHLDIVFSFGTKLSFPFECFSNLN